MNSKHIAIALSLTAVALVTGAAYVNRSPSELPIPTVPAPTASVPPTEPKAVRMETLTPANVKPAPSSVSRFTWQQVESGDYKLYIANLRKVGCPEQTIRDIIVADVNKLYAPREEPLKAKKSVPQMPGQTTPPADETENRRKLREVQSEKRVVLKELLDIDVPVDLMASTASRDYTAHELALKLLPAEKRDAVQALQEDYWQQSDALKAKYENKKSPEFVEEHRKLNESHRQELAKVLTSQELENYDMRTSSTSSKLGQQLLTFSPTEEEFRKVFRLTRDSEEKPEKVTVQENTPEARAAAAKAQADARAELDNQIKTALGDARFAEYQRSLDSSYQNLSRVGQRYGLSSDAIIKAYEMEKAFRSEPVAFPQPGFEVDRSAAQNQFNEQMKVALGEKAARAYRQLRGGNRVVDSEP
ncbi:MAG: hypothetical protein EXS31_04695 [Pedosphaera sp.]|nr:hypothetical protein [Pedosphaera sp.]